MQHQTLHRSGVILRPYQFWLRWFWGKMVLGIFYESLMSKSREWEALQLQFPGGVVAQGCRKVEEILVVWGCRRSIHNQLLHRSGVILRPHK